MEKTPMIKSKIVDLTDTKLVNSACLANATDRLREAEITSSMRMNLNVCLDPGEWAIINPDLRYFASDNPSTPEIVQVVGSQILTDKGWHAVGSHIYFKISDDKQSFVITNEAIARADEDKDTKVLEGILPVTIIYKLVSTEAQS